MCRRLFGVAERGGRYAAKLAEGAARRSGQRRRRAQERGGGAIAQQMGVGGWNLLGDGGSTDSFESNCCITPTYQDMTAERTFHINIIMLLKILSRSEANEKSYLT